MTTSLRLGQITADPEAWPRQGLDEERVGEFAEKYEDEGLAAFPPLEVVDCGEGQTYLLADGWHRLEALKRIEAPEAVVVVINPQGHNPLTVAYEIGLRTAATSARPLMQAERREAIRPEETLKRGRTGGPVAGAPGA